jgi:transposase
MWFLHDNAKIYTATCTSTWLAENNIRLLKIPPYSPDLNGIENVWPHLKKNMYLVDPELDSKPKSEATIDHIKSTVLPEAWNRINNKVFSHIIKSYPKRLQAIIDAKGWWTKY